MSNITRIIKFIKRHSVYFKIAVSIMLLFWVFSKVDLNELIKIIPELKLMWLLLLLAALFVNLLIGSYKWFRFLEFANLSFSFRKIFKISGTSLFYNQVLPGRIGGDVVKLMYLIDKKKDSASNYKAGISIFIDRFSNIIGLLFLSYLSVILSFQYHRDYIPYLLIFSIISFFIVFLIFMGPAIFLRFLPGSWQKIREIISKLKEGKTFINSLEKSLFFVFSGLIIQFIAILAQYFTGNALGINLDLEYYLFFVPLVFIITLIPISFGGFGVREMSYVFFLQQVGVSTEKAIMLSLITYVGVVLISIPFVFLKSDNLKTK